jgi:hypothetical protein
MRRTRSQASADCRLAGSLARACRAIAQSRSGAHRCSCTSQARRSRRPSARRGDKSWPAKDARRWGRPGDRTRAGAPRERQHRGWANRVASGRSRGKLHRAIQAQALGKCSQMELQRVCGPSEGFAARAATRLTTSKPTISKRRVSRQFDYIGCEKRPQIRRFAGGRERAFRPRHACLHRGLRFCGWLCDRLEQRGWFCLFGALLGALPSNPADRRGR